MKAVVYHAPKDIRVEQIPTPRCGAGDLLVKVDACAVCGTDLKTWKVGNPRITPPKVMGHEFTGIVGTTGERVVMATSVSCGDCLYCKRGWRNLCVNLAPMGFTYDGGMAESVVIPERAVQQGHVVKVPGHVKAVHAALAEPVSCAVNAAENCQIAKGDTVAVLGAGPMGILNAVVAREFGAAKIILSELNPARLHQAEAFGFDRLINPAKEDLAQVIQDETGGYGADIVIVAAPAAQPQEQALNLVRKRGTVCLFASLPAGKSTLNMDSRPLHYGELRVVGTSDSTPAQVARAVELIARGTMPVEKIASHTLRLDDIMQAYALMESGEALRVVLTP
jgi:L-iditol 2-dehydrogenase